MSSSTPANPNQRRIHFRLDGRRVYQVVEFTAAGIVPVGAVKPVTVNESTPGATSLDRDIEIATGGRGCRGCGD